MLRPRRSPRPLAHLRTGASLPSPGSPDTLVPGMRAVADQPLFTSEQTPSGGERVIRAQQQRLQLFRAWVLWRSHTWRGVQSNYAVKLEAMQERVAALRNSAPRTPDASLDHADTGASRVRPSPDGEVRTFVVNSPQRFRSSDVLLNKLCEAQIFIQQAVAENTALRNYVHLLRAVHHWRLSVAGANRKRQLLKSILLGWAKGELAKAWRAWQERVRRRAELAVIATKIVVKWQNAQVGLLMRKAWGGREERKGGGRKQNSGLCALYCVYLTSTDIGVHLQVAAAILFLPRLFMIPVRYVFAGAPVLEDLEWDNVPSKSRASCSKVQESSGPQTLCATVICDFMTQDIRATHTHRHISMRTCTRQASCEKMGSSLALEGLFTMARERS